MTTHKIKLLNNGDRGVSRDYWATCTCGWSQLTTDPPIHVIDFEADTSTLPEWKAEARAEAQLYGDAHLNDVANAPGTPWHTVPEMSKSHYHPADKRRAEALTLLVGYFKADEYGEPDDAEYAAGSVMSFVQKLFGITSTEIDREMKS